MTRETYKKEFGGVEVEFLAALEAGEVMDIDDIAKNAIQMRLTETGEKIFEPVAVGPVEKQTREAIMKACVVSVAGKGDNIEATLRKLSIHQYNAILEECNKIKGGLSEEKKSE